jgi:apolipoprotein N-acyltransferase
VEGGLGRGADGPLYPARDARFGVLICFESAFAPLARRYRREGADFLVNVTNDAWFGDEGRFQRTGALWQHPAHLVLRAIETRAGVARAANTGISMFIDPVGRVHQATPLFREDVRTGPVLTTDGSTVYVRWGDWLPTAATGVAVLLVLAAARRQRPARA